MIAVAGTPPPIVPHVMGAMIVPQIPICRVSGAGVSSRRSTTNAESALTKI